MTNTTDEYWEIDDVSIQTYAYNIETWGGSRQGVPEFKGEDFDPVDVPGSEWQPKMPDSRTITFAGWVRGTSEDGTEAADPHAKMTANWRKLRNLFWRTDRQIKITKRWRLEDGTIMSAVGYGEFAGGLEPDSSDLGTSGAKFTVDVYMSFPYFVGDEVGPITVNDATPTTINVLGDDTTRMVTLELNATSGNMAVENTTIDRRIEVPNDAILDVFNYVATGCSELDVDVTGYDQDDYWFPLLRGNNHIVTGGGAVNVRYYPLYL